MAIQGDVYPKLKVKANDMEYTKESSFWYYGVMNISIKFLIIWGDEYFHNSWKCMENMEMPAKYGNIQKFAEICTKKKTMAKLNKLNMKVLWHGVYKGIKFLIIWGKENFCNSQKYMEKYGNVWKIWKYPEIWRDLYQLTMAKLDKLNTKVLCNVNRSNISTP